MAESADLDEVIADWTTALYEEGQAVHHWDVRAGAALYRVFLLESGLQVDIAFTPELDFGARSPSFELAFGEPVEVPPTEPPAFADVAGLGWLGVLHANKAIERGRPWEAAYWVASVRDQTLALACLRLGESPYYSRGVDRLPPGSRRRSRRASYAASSRTSSCAPSVRRGAACSRRSPARTPSWLTAYKRPSPEARLPPMARDDWRIRIELDQEQARGFLERLGIDISSRAKELAKELALDRLAVSHDADTVFVYAASAADAEQARSIVEAELEESDITPRQVVLEHWLDEDDRWDSEADQPDVEEELVARGFAPWEVRVECTSHDEADRLGDQLEADGYDVVRRWTYVIVGTRTREEADALAKRVHGEVEAGGELVWEVMPQNPFAVFGGLGG